MAWKPPRLHWLGYTDKTHLPLGNAKSERGFQNLGFSLVRVGGEGVAFLVSPLVVLALCVVRVASGKVVLARALATQERHPKGGSRRLR
ncbi:hypothetical protein I8752_19585 [Nostocaceae cyanobacterium CENA369]|uniref:Uncharacterized protein n=1 Tax=Dendronalium phyllosphericum CENA369 TaxID=1725256 RepID=A0A8J7ID96_9NOST|nr:hypothetical protein [Dendronalium phyllosphericum]MBH8575177.1 hypothetical protein [Dendronalium phyllosphericum CENA369]